MERQPLSTLERLVIGLLSDLALEADLWPNRVLDRHEDNWFSQIKCLSSGMRAHLSQSTCDPERRQGIRFPVRGDDVDEPDGGAHLTTDQAIQLADRLEAQAKAIPADAEHPWQHWLPDIGQWPESFELGPAEILEIVQVLRQAVEYVTYGPEELPFDRDKLTAAIMDSQVTISVEPTWDYSEVTPGWNAKIQLMGGLGVIELAKGPNCVWCTDDDAAALAMEASTWGRLEPALEAAVAAAIAGGALEESER
jgi:hypothetical protein